MSQQAKDAKSDLRPAKKGRRVHKRTIAVVLCVVIFPWVLIAIPGTLDTGGQVSGWNIYHLLHGWPFVHLESTHYQNVGNSEEGRYRLSRLPWDMDKATSAKEAAAIFTKGQSPAQLNLRLEKERYRPHWIGKVGFWSEGSSWPALKTGVHFTPRYVGVLLNLFCLALLVSIVAALCERRIRRHERLLKYSLANLFIGTALIAVACAWIARMHLDHAAQARVDDQLQTISSEKFKDNNELYYFSKSHESRFPLIISQLLNHGKHSWGAVPFFRQVKSGHVMVRISKESDLDRLKRIASLVSPNEYSVELDLNNFNSKTQKMLNALDGANLVSLSLSFGDYRALLGSASLALGRDGGDLARVQASNERSWLMIEEMQEDRGLLKGLVGGKLFAGRKKVGMAERQQAGQKLAEQRKESQLRTDNPRPHIGIYAKPLEDEDGVRIEFVLDNSPADQADLRVGDVILKIDDKVATSQQQLSKTVLQYEVGDRVTLTVRRGSKEMKIKPTLADRSKYSRGNKPKGYDWVKTLEEKITARKTERSNSKVFADADTSLGKLLNGLMAKRKKKQTGSEADLDADRMLQEKIDAFLMTRTMRRSDFEVNIDIDMSKLESLALRLNTAISQEEQLQPFVGLPSLKIASISRLSIEDAEFLLSTKEQWPENMEVRLVGDYLR